MKNNQSINSAVVKLIDVLNKLLDGVEADLESNADGWVGTPGEDAPPLDLRPHESPVTSPLIDVAQKDYVDDCTVLLAEFCDKITKVQQKAHANDITTPSGTYSIVSNVSKSLPYLRGEVPHEDFWLPRSVERPESESPGDSIRRQGTHKVNWGRKLLTDVSNHMSLYIAEASTRGLSSEVSDLVALRERVYSTSDTGVQWEQY